MAFHLISRGFRLQAEVKRTERQRLASFAASLLRVLAFRIVADPPRVFSSTAPENVAIR
jgi:hypothetical protein